MKKVLIVAAVAIAVVVVAVQIAEFFHFGDKHVRAGHFDIYTTPRGLPDSSASSALYYSRHRLTGYLSSYAADPNNPDRIIFSSDDIYHRNESVCGTFLYNGQSQQLTRLRTWPYAAGSRTTWSPDSHYILLDRATIRELATGDEFDLSEFVSKKNGERVELTPLQWSPDGKRLAARLVVSTVGRDWGEDLVEITVSSHSFRYVASRRGSLTWTDEDVRWADGELQVASAATSKQDIFVKPPDDVAWTSSPPNSPPPSPLHEHFCAPVQSTSR